jgi:Fur family ferric uptake transcriptional regulator
VKKRIEGFPMAIPSNTPVMNPDNTEAWDRFVNVMKKGGGRITEARRIVLDNVLARGEHFRAENLASDLAQGPHRVSRGTVYRTLRLMVETGLVRSFHPRGLGALYECTWKQPNHAHLICTRCGSIAEVGGMEIERAINRQCSEQGFAGREFRMEIYGVCRRCIKQQEE